MKKLFLVISVFVMGMFLMSCGPTREHSENLSEKATIVSMIYSPSEHHTDIEPTMMKGYGYGYSGKYGGAGIGYSGKVGTRIGKHYQITETTVPEQFGVVFQCQHGTFTIQGPGVKDGQISKYKVLYDKLNNHINDTVNVIYQEIYDVTYEKQNGKQVETKRVLVDLDFIDAQLLK